MYASTCLQMGFMESHQVIQMHELRSQRCQLKAMEANKLVPSRHKRSKSDTENRLNEYMFQSPSTSCDLKQDMEERGESHIGMKKKMPDTKVQDTLKQEILQLEKRLKDQLAVHQVLEKALGYRPTVVNPSSDSFMPKPAKELIREIAVLEVEVMKLEQYLLTLYRKAFDHQIHTSSPIPPKAGLKQPICCQMKQFDEVPGPEISSKESLLFHSTRILPSQMSLYNLLDESNCENLADPSILRCHSALNQRAVYSSRISPSEEALARALQDCHSQPLSFLADGVICLAEYLGANIADHVPDTPNKISEDMVRCMGAIYSRIADPPLVIPGSASSPTSSSSSLNAISPQFIGDTWSPGIKNESVLDSRLVNPFCIESMKQFSGPYSAMVEVPAFFRDSGRLKIVEGLLNTYKCLVHKLVAVNVKKMKNDEKLPFWINLHNALVMHAYLAHGVPQNSTKRTSLLIKATCIVGGRSINADMIRGSFLGCRAHCSGQWLRTFMLPMIKLKTRDEWKRVYAIEKREPFLHFALCLGTHSDPAVRIYTSKRLYEQLETAKEEYIGATLGIQKEQKVLLPKLIEHYTKDNCMSSENIFDMIQPYIPATMRMEVQRCRRGRAQKIIEWLPHNFSFRYLLSREVAYPHSPVRCSVIKASF